MKEKEKIFKRLYFKDNYELNMPEFYKELNKAIRSNNIQSIYQLSKIFTRQYFKNLNN
ncbi:hypothetical protein LCGC14_0628400 [marine sediment metagenome]|uniref:Uncharacterized protein n=1 Tax=marine sediment metagenome TaxID=412755 RepID=A0A0F9TP75_9ZZZZ